MFQRIFFSNFENGKLLNCNSWSQEHIKFPAVQHLNNCSKIWNWKEVPGNNYHRNLKMIKHRIAIHAKSRTQHFSISSTLVQFWNNLKLEISLCSRD